MRPPDKVTTLRTVDAKPAMRFLLKSRCTSKRQDARFSTRSMRLPLSQSVLSFTSASRSAEIASIWFSLRKSPSRFELLVHRANVSASIRWHQRSTDRSFASSLNSRSQAACGRQAVVVEFELAQLSRCPEVLEYLEPVERDVQRAELGELSGSRRRVSKRERRVNSAFARPLGLVTSDKSAISSIARLCASTANLLEFGSVHSALWSRESARTGELCVHLQEQQSRLEEGLYQRVTVEHADLERLGGHGLVARNRLLWPFSDAPKQVYYSDVMG